MTSETPFTTVDLSHWKDHLAVRREHRGPMVSLFLPEKCTECNQEVYVTLTIIPATDRELSANKIPLVEYLPPRGQRIREDLGLGSHLLCPTCYVGWLDPKARDYD